MPQLGQFSFLLALALLAFLLVSVTWSRPRFRPLGFLAAALLLGGWWFVRPGAGGAASADALAAARASGRPVVVEIYSDY